MRRYYLLCYYWEPHHEVVVVFWDGPVVGMAEATRRAVAHRAVPGRRVSVLPSCRTVKRQVRRWQRGMERNLKSLSQLPVGVSKK